ncbi:MAG: XdhC family protein [Kiloniellales bacterium]
MKKPLFEKLQAARAAKRPVAVVTRLADGQQALVEGGQKPFGELALDARQLAAAETALVEDRSGLLPEPDQGLFLQVFNPPLRLFLVGAVHISQALAPLAALAGYEVTVIDPRRAWATESRFPGIALVDEWPDEGLKTLKPDRRSAIVTLTHDPKLDDPALLVALPSPAFYVGALGSKRTHAKRIERLKAEGLDDASMARIHGPVGLAIGAKSPAEIAISILAQMTQVLRQGGDKSRRAAA